MKAIPTNSHSFWRSRWAAYLLAVGLTALTLLVRGIIGSRFEGPTMIVFTIPIILSAYWGGMGPGLLATILSALGAAYYVLPPIFSFNVLSTTQRWQEAILLLAGLVISFICETLHRSRRRAEKVIAELRHKESELEAALVEQKQSEMVSSRLGEIVATSDDAIIGKDLNSIITSWNKSAERIFGYFAEEMVGTSIMRLIPTARHDEENQILAKIKRGENVEHFETRRQTKDGRLIDVSVTASPIKDITGKIVGVSKVARDITERKRTEKLLREREGQLRLYVEHSPVAISMFDCDMKYLVVSRRWMESYRLVGQSIIGRSHYEIFPEISQRWREIHRRCLAGAVEKNEEEAFLRADGKTDWIRWEVHPWHQADGKIGGIIIFSEDITDRKQVEAALRESEQRLRFTLESCNIGAWNMDLVDHTAYRSLEHARIFGYAELSPQWTLEDFLRHVLPEYRAEVEAIVHKATDARLDWTYECPIQRADGEIRWIWFTGRHFTDPSSGHNRVGGVVMDITARKQAEEARNKSEARYHTLFDYAPDGIVIVDSKGYYLDVNASICNMLGYTRDEFIGLNATDIVAPAEIPHIGQALDVIKNKSDYQREWQFRRKDGSIFAVDTMATAMPDGNLLAMIRDITERKQAEAALRDSEERFRTMANSITQLAWIARADGFIFWYNQRWYEYTGTTPEQMEGWGWQSVHDPAVLPKVMENWTGAIDAGKPFEMEFPLRGADGKCRTFLTRGQPLKDSEGRVVQWFGTNTDVEVLKQAEEKIHQLNVELEQRVTKRTAELEAANKELEAFSYSVSHDLRAPLRAVNGFAGIVLEEFSPLLPEEGRSYLERIRNGGQRMGVLIDDLLAFSRLSRQLVNRQSVDTTKLVQNVLDELKQQLDGRRIEIKIGELPACHGDPALLKQVWVNLISNAVKYTRGREPAIVEISGARENNENVYFVRDNGAGFDMQYADKLFGVFQRLHRNDEFEGTGVGLAIVQRIIHRHGGRVWAEAEINQGATFYFTLEGENKL